jgi:ferrous-iron efflux pump FieF
MTQTQSKQTTGKSLPQLASYASLSVALFLVGLKIWAWLATDSVAVLSSLADSFLDVLASGITVTAIWISSQPADREHRFGHGKAEGLAALIQALIITLSAFYVCYEAVDRFLNPVEVKQPGIGASVMAVAIILTLALQAFQHYVVKQTGSLAIAADATHYRSDLFINFGVGITIMLSVWTTATWIDPAVGILVAIVILYSTYSIATDALDVLLDKELPQSDRQRIYAIAIDHPEVHGFHDLRTRFGGARCFIQFHLELEPEISLTRTHEILDEVEDSVRAAYPQADIIVHPDPLGFEERRDQFD